MASSADYLYYVLDLLADVPEATTRRMMGEYLLYASGKLFGGIYDDRFLVKDTPVASVIVSRTLLCERLRDISVGIWQKYRLTDDYSLVSN